MENSQAPNYLTTLDSYAFGDDTSYASINMAKSGTEVLQHAGAVSV